MHEEGQLVSQRLLLKRVAVLNVKQGNSAWNSLAARCYVLHWTRTVEVSCYSRQHLSNTVTAPRDQHWDPVAFEVATVQKLRLGAEKVRVAATVQKLEDEKVRAAATVQKLGDKKVRAAAMVQKLGDEKVRAAAMVLRMGVERLVGEVVWMLDVALAWRKAVVATVQLG